jgi:hypothetical protein
MAGTDQVASPGKPVMTVTNWPDGTMELVNDPLRTSGWNPFFSELSNEVNFYEYKIRGTADVNHLLELLAAIQCTNATVLLSPDKQSKAGGDAAEKKRTAVTFSIGDQQRLDEWYARLPEVEPGVRGFGLWRYKEPPVTTPPTLIIFCGHEAVNLKQVKIPASVKVVADVEHAETGTEETVKAIKEFVTEREATADTALKFPLSLAIRCTNDVMKAGDEIDIEFRITNRGTNDYKYADRTYDRSGRMDEYKLVATNSSGEAVPDPRAGHEGGWFGGGLFNYQILKPGESFTKVIPLNRWSRVKEPGRYSVTGTYQSERYSTNSENVISAPVTVDVQPRTEREMDDYISGISNQIAAIPPVRFIASTQMPENVRVTNSVTDPGLGTLVIKLMYTCSPKIVPVLLNTIAEPASGGFWEHEAILFYVPHSEETKKAILAAASARESERNWCLAPVLREYDFTKDELKPLIERALASDDKLSWGIGAELAGKYWDETFIERLAAIALNPTNGARVAAIKALAAHRTDEGVKTLKSLLDDPQKNLWVPLAQALENAELQGTFHPDDFNAEDVKPLIRRLLAAGRNSSELVTGTGLAQHFGSDEFTPRLIALVNDPGNWAWYLAVHALALNRTDDGVKTLKSLLASSNEVAAEAIRYAYTNQLHYRGRPLKPDDFDKQYQQPKTGN